MIRSRTKLTVSPASSPWVILDFNEKIDDVVKPGGSKLTEVIPLLRASSPLIRNAENVTYQFTYTVERAAVSDAASAVAMWDSLITWAGRNVAPLRVDLADVSTHYWLFSSCAVSQFTPQGRTVALGRTLTQYTITATGLSKVAV